MVLFVYVHFLVSTVTLHANKNKKRQTLPVTINLACSILFRLENKAILKSLLLNIHEEQMDGSQDLLGASTKTHTFL